MSERLSQTQGGRRAPTRVTKLVTYRYPWLSNARPDGRRKRSSSPQKIMKCCAVTPALPACRSATTCCSSGNAPGAAAACELSSSGQTYLRARLQLLGGAHKCRHNLCATGGDRTFVAQWDMQDNTLGIYMTVQVLHPTHTAS